MESIPIEIQRVILNQLDASSLISFMLASRRCLHVVKEIVRLREKLPGISNYLTRNDIACFILSNTRGNLFFLVPRAATYGKVLCLISVHKKYPDINIDRYYQYISASSLADLLALLEVTPTITKERFLNLAIAGCSRVIRYLANRFGVSSKIVIGAYMNGDEELIKYVESRCCHRCRRVLAMWCNEESVYNKYFGDGPLTLAHPTGSHTFPLEDSSISLCCGIENNVIGNIVMDAIRRDRTWIIRRLWKEQFRPASPLIIVTYIGAALMSNSYRVLEILLKGYKQKITQLMYVKLPADILNRQIYKALNRCSYIRLTLRESCYTLYKTIDRSYGKRISQFDITMRQLGESILDHYKLLCDRTKSLSAALNIIELGSHRRRDFISIFNENPRHLYHAIRYAIIKRHLLAAKYLVAAYIRSKSYDENSTMDDYITVHYDLETSCSPIIKIEPETRKNARLIQLLASAITNADLLITRLLLPYAYHKSMVVPLKYIREEAIPLIEEANVKVSFSRSGDPFLLPPCLFDSTIIANDAVPNLVKNLVDRNHVTGIEKLKQHYPRVSATLNEYAPNRRI